MKRKAITLGYRTPNTFRRNIKHKLALAKIHDKIRKYEDKKSKI